MGKLIISGADICHPEKIFKIIIGTFFENIIFDYFRSHSKR
jgi:hypothetical protein